MNRENLVSLWHALAGVGVIVAGISLGADLPVPRDVARFLGGAIFLLGMAVFVWAVVYLRGAFLGHVEPRQARLIRGGPYRWVRHPLYLGMVISTLGLAVGLRSLWCLIGVLLVFAPLGVCRAWLEERALARTFGREWAEYVGRTYFMFPPVW